MGLDIVPPVHPSQAPKRGFFSKIFGKSKEEESVPEVPINEPSEENLDLQEIRKKLGLDEEQPKLVIEEPITAPEEEPTPEPRELKNFPVDNWKEHTDKPAEHPNSTWVEEETKEPVAESSEWEEHGAPPAETHSEDSTNKEWSEPIPEPTAVEGEIEQKESDQHDEWAAEMSAPIAEPAQESGMTEELPSEPTEHPTDQPAEAYQPAIQSSEQSSEQLFGEQHNDEHDQIAVPSPPSLDEQPTPDAFEAEDRLPELDNPQTDAPDSNDSAVDTTHNWASPTEQPEQKSDAMAPESIFNSTNSEMTEQVEPVDASEPGLSQERDALETPSEPIEQTLEPSSETHAAAEEHFSEIENEHVQLHDELDKITSGDHLDIPVNDGDEFILKNGMRLKSLRELCKALEIIDQEVFAHHVSRERNDFANWIANVIKDEDLADQIKKKRSAKQMIKILTKPRKHTERALESGANLAAKFESLKADLAKKSAELALLRDDHHHNATKHITAEVENRLADEKKKLDEKIAELEKQRQEYESKLADVEGEAAKKLEERERDLAEREQQLSQNHDSIAEQERGLEAQRTSLSDEKQSAQVLIARAQEAQQLQDAIKQDREEFEQEKIKLQEAHADLEHRKQEQHRIIEEAEKTRSEIENLEGDLKKQQDELAAREEKVAHAEDEAKNLLADERGEVAKLRDEVEKERSQAQREREQFQKEEKLLEEERQKIEQSRKEIMEQEQEQKVVLEKERREIEREQERMLRQLQDRERVIEDRIRRAEETEHRVEEKLKERRKIAKYLRDAESQYEQHKNTLAGPQLDGYLSKQLNEIKNTPPTAPKSTPPAAEGGSMPIYSLIDNAKKAIHGGDVVNARMLYNTIRDEFNKADITPEEKSMLYTTIRELYDDIHAASVGI